MCHRLKGGPKLLRNGYTFKKDIPKRLNTVPLSLGLYVDQSRIRNLWGVYPDDGFFERSLVQPTEL